MNDLLYQRRSIRAYQSTSVEDEKVRELIKAALLAPSGRGVNSQRFIVIDDRDLLEKLSKAKELGSAFLKDAPLAFVVLGDTNLTDIWVEDACIAAITIQLSAQSLGLGSCWTQIRNRKHSDQKMAEEYIQELLSIPKEIRVECMIGIGYPDESKSPRNESDLGFEKVSVNNYNNKYSS